jgi:DNA polymerase III epsilon subunit-like protein
MLFAVWDSETTGLPLHPDAALHLQPKMIEFGGIITDGFDIFDEVNFKINPEQKLESVITDITGITDDDLKDQPTFDHYIPDIRRYFEQARGRVSHNLAFDRGILSFDLRRYGKTLQDVNWFPGIEICTVEQTFQEYGKRKKLKDLYEELVGPHTQTHRALEDVYMLHAICQKIGLYEAFNVDHQ